MSPHGLNKFLLFFKYKFLFLQNIFKTTSQWNDNCELGLFEIKNRKVKSLSSVAFQKFLAIGLSSAMDRKENERAKSHRFCAKLNS